MGRAGARRIAMLVGSCCDVLLCRREAGWSAGRAVTCSRTDGVLVVRAGCGQERGRLQHGDGAR